MKQDSEAISTFIFGATGYTGQELVKILSKHPLVRIKAVTSEQNAGSLLSEQCPLKCALELVSLKSALNLVTEGSVSFLCLPHGESSSTAAQIIARGGKVIDLSADFRLKDPALYEKWYGAAHPEPEILQEAVYGICELSASDLTKKRLVANPGCYPTSVILALVPLLRQGLINKEGIIIDSKSGTTGAGRSAKTNLLFAECDENFNAYNVGRSHRHVPEINSALFEFSMLNKKQSANEAQPEVLFTPHLLPVRRGILSTIYVKSSLPQNKCAERNDILEAWKKAYEECPFIWVQEKGLPHLAQVVYTNRCALGCAVSGQDIIIVSAIDNLLKGAAGQAVQNFNRMAGVQDTVGLESLL